jgi:hypothetical protein
MILHCSPRFNTSDSTLLRPVRAIKLTANFRSTYKRKYNTGRNANKASLIDMNEKFTEDDAISFNLCPCIQKTMIAQLEELKESACLLNETPPEGIWVVLDDYPSRVKISWRRALIRCLVPAVPH